MFEYPLDLHYSQTDIVFPGFLCSLNTLWIYTTLKQKGVLWYFECLFEYPLDLHYSQTSQDQSTLLLSLNTLWIYTTLKPALHLVSRQSV